MASPALDTLKELEALRSAKQFQALLDQTSDVLRRPSLNHELFSSHQFWTYRGFACMQLLATEPPSRAAAAFQRALLLGPPREKRFGLCSAVEVLQILESIERLREGRHRFGQRCDGYDTTTTLAAPAPGAATEGHQKRTDPVEDTQMALRRMLSSACAEQPEEPYDDRAVQEDGIVRFVDVEKPALILGSVADPFNRNHSAWDALRYVFFTDADCAGWLYLGSEDERSWGKEPRQMLSLSGMDSRVPGLVGERCLPPGVFVSGAGCHQSVDAQLWLKTAHFDFRDDRGTLDMSARHHLRCGAPLLLPRRFPRWDALLASPDDAGSVRQPHPELDVFYVPPERTGVPRAVHECLRDELDRLAKRSGPADFPVPKYHNILDPNKFAAAERVLEFVGTDGGPRGDGGGGGGGAGRSGGTAISRDIYAVDYPAWAAAAARRQRGRAPGEPGQEGSGGDDGCRGGGAAASSSSSRASAQWASPLAGHGGGRPPLRWTCAEVRVKQTRRSVRERVVLLRNWARRACGGKLAARFSQPLVRSILEFAGYVQAAARVEWTSGIHNLDPLRHHKLYFALARVLEAAMPLVARLKKPALLLQSESLPEAYREGGSTLQVVVKAQRIFLSPGEDYVGLWHQDGLHEHICAAVLYYYRAGALDGGALEFCSAASRPLDGAWEAASSARAPPPPRCQVPVREGTLVVFSNYQVVHRVLRMQARQGAGSRDFVAFFLVDQARPLRVGDHATGHGRRPGQPRGPPQTDAERLGFLEKQLRPRVGFGTHQMFGLTTTGNGDPRDLGWVQAELTGAADAACDDDQRRRLQDEGGSWSPPATAAYDSKRWLGGDRSPVARLQGLNFPPPLGRGASWGMDANRDRAMKWQVLSPWVAVVEAADDGAEGQLPNQAIAHFRHTVTGEVVLELPADKLGHDKVGISDVEFV